VVGKHSEQGVLLKGAPLRRREQAKSHAVRPGKRNRTLHQVRPRRSVFELARLGLGADDLSDAPPSSEGCVPRVVSAQRADSLRRAGRVQARRDCAGGA